MATASNKVTGFFSNDVQLYRYKVKIDNTRKGRDYKKGEKKSSTYVVFGWVIAEDLLFLLNMVTGHLSALPMSKTIQCRTREFQLCVCACPLLTPLLPVCNAPYV